MKLDSSSERSIQRIGDSFLITVPKSWATGFQLRGGSKVRVWSDESGVLHVAPTTNKAFSNPTIISLEWNQSFYRSFFRAYFAGYSTIRIQKKSLNSFKPFSEVHEFIKLFFNVQIVDESPTEITIKTFQIPELAIPECVNRMYFCVRQSTTLLQESSFSKDSFVRYEQQLTQLYFLAILQIRRFIDRGQFAETNQITLLRALDYRMVAEKLERINDLLYQNASLLVSSSELPTFQLLLEQGFHAFVQEKFELALDHAQTNQLVLDQWIQKKIKVTSKDWEQYQIAATWVQLYGLVKEISYLTR